MMVKLFAKGTIAALVLTGCAAAPMPDPSLYKNTDPQAEKEQDPNLESGNAPSTGTPNASTDAQGSSAFKTEKACVDAGFYFDLATNECTNRRLVKVTCTVENITNTAGSDYRTQNPGATADFLADNQKSQVKFLFTQGELKDYQLRYCVDDIQQYTLVAVKDVNGQKQVQDVDVPK